MKKIFVCSRLRGKTPEEYQKNVEVVKSLCRIVAMLGNMPIAPHAYFPNFLNDNNEAERKLGIEMGLDLLLDCDEIWVFDFNGVSEGMETEINYASKRGMAMRYFGGVDFPLSKQIITTDNTCPCGTCDPLVLPGREARYQPFDYNDNPVGGEF